MSAQKKPDYYDLTIYPKNRDISKSWYVELTFTDPATGESCRKQYRNGINYFKTLAERTKEAKALIKALELKLSTGWNPMLDGIPAKDVTASLPDMPFNQALDYALETKKLNLEPKSYSDIRGVVNFAKVAAIKLRLHLNPIGETKRAHIKLLLEQISKDRQAAYDKEGKNRKWTGNSYNKYKRYIQLLFTELEEYEAVEFNPCNKINDRPEIATNLHRHATEKEKQLIKNHLWARNKNFYTYLETEYLTGIRPKELFGLQVHDIDWLNQCFDIGSGNGKSKTKKARKVPIPNTLLHALEGLNLKYAQADDFIFSDDFRPGIERKNRDYATKLWKQLVKDELKVSVSLYSFKGLGGEDKRKAGVDAGAVSSQYGHSSMNMTMRYLHGEQDRINKDIIEKTPAF